MVRFVVHCILWMGCWKDCIERNEHLWDHVQLAYARPSCEDTYGGAGEQAHLRTEIALLSVWGQEIYIFSILIFYA